MLKTDKLSSISHACWLTEGIFESVLENFGRFRTEKDVAGFISTQVKKKGLKLAFKTIVGSGSGGSEPHHVPALGLCSGFCVIDFGVKVNGYCSDFTRTVFLGKPAEKDLRLYNLVSFAQKAGIKALGAGIPASKPYFAASKLLGRYSKNFVHGLGHGVGQRIHSKPFMKKKSVDVLKEGDIVTVEPGIYFKGRFGIRIEDMFLVTGKGSVPITKFSTKLTKIPF